MATANDNNAGWVVYLIHADQPYMGQSGRLKVQHYIGTAKDLDARIGEHRATTWTPLAEVDYSGEKPHRGTKTGQGATLLGIFNSLGIGWEVVKTWPGGPRLEHKLKRQKHAWRHCSECRKHRRVPSGTRRKKNGNPGTR